MQLWLFPTPRQLVLSTDHFALVFRPPPPSEPASPDVVVEFLPLPELDFSGAILVNSRVAGCLGVLRVGDDTFLPIITSSVLIATHSSLIGSGVEPISRILQVEFYSLTSPTYDALTSNSYASAFDALPTQSDDYDVVSASGNLSGPNPDILEHPCAGIRKILSSGSFYFSGDAGEATIRDDTFDITSRLEARLARAAAAASSGSTAHEEDDAVEGEDASDAWEEVDPRFLWNTYLIAPLVAFRRSLPKALRKVLDREAFVVRAIQGFCGLYDVSIGGEKAVLSLISRLGWKRAGTRFNVRGIDDDGSVANFVETETILRTASNVFSYVQIRGSVPVFWEEIGMQPFGQKITVTRPLEASLPAFTRHFAELLETYDDVHIINLLSTKDQEALLTEAYELHLERSGFRKPKSAGGPGVGMTNFDFHARSKVGGIESVKNSLASIVGPIGEGFGACLASVEGGRGEDGTSLVVGQRGVFRTNCKDWFGSGFLSLWGGLSSLTQIPLLLLLYSSLDRTNVVEDILSGFAIVDYLRNTSPTAFQGADATLWTSHRVLWAENGDALSKIYVGTGALNTSFTRSGKKSFAGLLSDATKSVGRMYQSNFNDGGKQRSIDALLGNLSGSQKVRVYNPVNDALHAAVRARSADYETFDTSSVWVGTYNLNGRGPGSESLLPWLFPPCSSGPEPSILVIAFQEIVPLTPQMIMATDPEKKRRWEAHILRTVGERPDKKSDYILLRSGQLVGTALIVLIKTELANDVRNVEAATKKTGMKGMAGNKGAVAIRLDFKDTSFCFLTAHLAAGHSNVEERNADYFTISEGLHFSRGRRIADHDNVIWASDTNYRINLPNEEARRLAVEDNFSRLYEDDQLAAAMRTRGVFAGYYEAPLLFPPTYKYDNGTDMYDTSEKKRIPAWTDRILYKGRELDVSRYQRAELLASDHRPVYAIFRAKIRTIDHKKRAALRKAILQDILAKDPGAATMDKARHARIHRGFEEAAQGLPAPSDDHQAWWNDSDYPDGTYFPDPTIARQRNPSITDPFSDDFLLIQPPPSAPPPSPNPSPNLPGRPAPRIPPKKSLSTGGASLPPPASRRKPPPPVPATLMGDDDLLSPISSVGSLTPTLANGGGRKVPPPVPTRPGVRRSPSATSLLEDSDDEGGKGGGGVGMAGSWEVIAAN